MSEPGLSRSGRDARDRQAKEDVATVAQLGSSLAPELIQSIYDEVVLGLALKVGLRPDKKAKKSSDDSVEI